MKNSEDDWMNYFVHRIGRKKVSEATGGNRFALAAVSNSCYFLLVCGEVPQCLKTSNILFVSSLMQKYHPSLIK